MAEQKPCPLSLCLVSTWGGMPINRMWLLVQVSLPHEGGALHAHLENRPGSDRHGSRSGPCRRGDLADGLHGRPEKGRGTAETAGSRFWPGGQRLEATGRRL